MEEKKETSATVTAVSVDEEANIGQTVEKASKWAMFPWFGVVALFLSFFTILASMGILIAAHDSPIDHWPQWGPSTYLGAIASAANVLVHIALAEGVIIAWWYRASKQNTTIKELHETYLRSISTVESVKSLRSPSTMAIAIISVALIALNGPILQRSVTSAPNDKQTPTTLHVPIVRDLNAVQWNTATYVGSDVPSVLTQPFSVTATTWLFNTAQTWFGTGCDGSCDGTVTGAGFAVSCVDDTVPFSIPVIEHNNIGNTSLDSIPHDSVLVFNVSIAWTRQKPGVFVIQTLDKADGGCSGQLARKTCTLTAAAVDYPFSIYGDQNTVTTIYATGDMTTNHVVEVTGANLPEEYNDDASIYGGFYLVLKDKYTASAEVRTNVAQSLQDVHVTGSLSNYYAVSNTSFTQQACGITYTNSPMDSILSDIQTLSFSTALDAGVNQTGWTSASFGSGLGSGWLADVAINIEQTKSETIYKTSPLYWGLSVLITGIACFGVAPIYRGWWVLRRKVSLSPIETARAFSAPGLVHHADGSAPPPSTGDAASPAAGDSTATTPQATTPGGSVAFGVNIEDTPHLLDRVGNKRIRESLNLHLPVKADPMKSPAKAAHGGIGYFFPHPVVEEKSEETASGSDAVKSPAAEGLKQD